MAWYWIVLIAYFSIGIVLGLINFKKTAWWDWRDFFFTLFCWGPMLLLLGYVEAAKKIEGRKK